jgi:hypothetical protein
MKYSKGFNLTAGTSTTILTVPTGYDACVTYLFISNVGGSAKNVSATWHDGVDVAIVTDKSLGANDFLQFGGPVGAFLIMREGDYMTVESSSGSTFSVIISYDLYPAAPRLNI